jgi:hypothetical protein
MTPEEAAEVASAPDGWRCWVTVEAVTDGGSLRLHDGEGDRIRLDEVTDLVWDNTTRG